MRVRWLRRERQVHRAAVRLPSVPASSRYCPINFDAAGGSGAPLEHDFPRFRHWRGVSLLRGQMLDVVIKFMQWR